MKLTANSFGNPVTFDLVELSQRHVLIRDRNEGRSVTNSVKEVIQYLKEINVLMPHHRLFYYDTMDRLDEIVLKDGLFVHFAPCFERDLYKLCQFGVGR